MPKQLSNKKMNEMFNIPSWVKGNTPAEEFKSIKKRFENRPNTEETMEEILQALSQKQEFIKQQQGLSQPQPQPETEQFLHGGDVALSPEDQAQSDAMGDIVGGIPIAGSFSKAGGVVAGAAEDSKISVGNEGVLNFTQPWEQNKMLSSDEAKEAMKKQGKKPLAGAALMPFGMGSWQTAKVKRAIHDLRQEKQTESINNEIGGLGAKLTGNTNTAAYGGSVNDYMAAQPPCGGPGQVPCPKDEKQGFDWAGLTSSVVNAAASVYGATDAGGKSISPEMAADAGGGMAYGGKLNQYALGTDQHRCADGSYPPCIETQLGDMFGKSTGEEKKEVIEKDQQEEFTQPNKYLQAVKDNKELLLNAGLLAPSALKKIKRGKAVGGNEINVDYGEKNIDTEAIRSGIARQGRGYLNAARANAGGSGNRLAANTRAANLMTKDSIGNAMLQAQMANNAIEGRRSAFKGREAMFNSQDKRYTEDMNARTDAAYEMARQAKLTGLTESAQGMLKEKFDRDKVDKMFGYDPDGKYKKTGTNWTDPETGEVISDEEMQERRKAYQERNQVVATNDNMFGGYLKKKK